MDCLKQSCTHLITPFSGIVVHGISLGFTGGCVSSVSPRNYFLTGRNFPTTNKRLLFLFLKPSVRTKLITPCERAWITVFSNCVHFFFGSRGAYKEEKLEIEL